MINIYKVARLFAVAAVFCCEPTMRGTASLDSTREKFDFEKYERLSHNQETEAAGFLSKKFLIGTDAREALQFIEAGGAKCQFAHDNEYFYFCEYTRSGHGLMAFVSNIEWKVVIYTDNLGNKINKIEVGRGATGL